MPTTSANSPPRARSTNPDAGSRRGVPDWLAIAGGVLLGEFHRFFVAILLAALAVIAFSVRPDPHGYGWFFVFELIIQWVGLLIVFLVAVAVSRSRSPRCVHWLAVWSLVLDVALRFATGQYTASDPLWYHLGIPLGVVFAWAVTLRLVAGKSSGR